MKLKNKNVPPELQTVYNQLVNVNTAAPGGIQNARTSRLTKKPQKRKNKNAMLDAIKSAVDQLISFKRSDPNWIEPLNFRQQQIDNLRNRYFDPEYWAEQTAVVTTALEVIPTFTAFTGPRVYSYPDETNQPTKAVYANGSETTGAPTHTGQTIGDTYRDTYLRWNRYVVTLDTGYYKDTPEPMFLTIDGQIDAQANYRPSRAMLSTVWQMWNVTATSAKLTTTEPPTVKPITNLYRYKTLHGGPPYFSLTMPIQYMYDMRGYPKREENGLIEKAVILLSPMPMMGKRYNNNTTLTTTLNNLQVKVWQIKKVKPYMLKNGYYEDFAAPHPPFANVSNVDEAIAWMNNEFPQYAPYYFEANEITCSYDAPYQTMVGNILPNGYPNSTNDPTKLGQLNITDNTCGY